MLAEERSMQEMTELVSMRKVRLIAIRMNWLLDWGNQTEQRSGQEDNRAVPSRPSQVHWMQRSWQLSPQESRVVEGIFCTWGRQSVCHASLV
jgi:hypothetical protein